MEIILLFGLFFLFMLFTVPIGVSVGMASIITIAVTGVIDYSFIGRTMISAYDSFPILAIPLFLLAGEIMGKGGISERLFDFAALFVGRFTGGVPMAVVAACLMFGALSGSGAADTAAIGSVMIPAMIRMGYNPIFSASIVASAGMLGVIMPPSLPMIIYGISSNTSIGKLFMAGIIPAIIITVCLMIYCHVYCRIKGYTNDKLNFNYEKKGNWAVIRRSSLAIVTPAIILGGIYGGVFTPTEAAGVTVLYSLIISIFVFKTIKINQIYDVFRDSTRMIGPVMIILGAATIFSRVLTVERVPNTIANLIVGISDNPLVFLLLINIVLLVVGALMETLSSLLILTPIFLPVAMNLGIDPVHFGIIMVINLAIGFITPPMAGNLFIVSTISGISVEKISKGILVPLAILIVLLLLITYIPFISMVLPRYMN